MRAVHARLAAEIRCPVVTVAGTNGKGSTCAMLESILRCAGFRVGLYTSPHLVAYNERVRIDGNDATDAALIAAFDAVEDARVATRGTDGAPVALTYFEFGTLAALWLFARANLDVLVLEVGLGGRLDAVNVVDPDVAVLTSVAIDHVDYLGPTREDIGREKAGIFRAGRPAVCADPAPPASVVAAAQASGAQLLVIGRDYGYVNEGRQWRFRGPRGERFGLPVPALRGAYQLANAATVLAVLDLLHARLPVSAGAVREGLLAVTLPGRFQVLPGRPVTVLDVAHNPHAARALADALADMGYLPGDARGARHARRQGRGRRDRGDAAARRSLARRDAARPARRDRRAPARCAARRGRAAGRDPRARGRARRDRRRAGCRHRG